MTEAIPAIDLIDGQCQRLKQGDFQSKKAYPWDPLELARMMDQKGFKHLHLVDLEGAREKKLIHTEQLRRITQNTGLAVDFGGGIRKEADVKMLLEAGARYVILGSLAVNNPELVKGWMKKYEADRFILAADIRNDKVTTDAWSMESKLTLDQLVESFMEAGLQHLLCTDISRDGMLQGVNVQNYARLKQTFPGIRIIASGGVTTMNDLVGLDEAGIDAVVIGKALFEGEIQLEELAEWNKKYAGQ
jgi:phosphoribosylformimino-5-aminoimidazole carboxamide ribotide isomerase